MIDIIKEIKDQVKAYIDYTLAEQPERAAWALEGAIEDATDEVFDGDRARARKYISNLTMQIMYKGVDK